MNSTLSLPARINRQSSHLSIACLNLSVSPLLITGLMMTGKQGVDGDWFLGLLIIAGFVAWYISSTVWMGCTAFRLRRLRLEFLGPSHLQDRCSPRQRKNALEMLGGGLAHLLVGPLIWALVVRSRNTGYASTDEVSALIALIGAAFTLLPAALVWAISTFTAYRAIDLRTGPVGSVVPG